MNFSVYRTRSLFLGFDSTRCLDQLCVMHFAPPMEAAVAFTNKLGFITRLHSKSHFDSTSGRQRSRQRLRAKLQKKQESACLMA